MVEVTKKRTLVELILREKKSSEYPEVGIAINNEVAKNPVILTNVTFIEYFGPAYRKEDGGEFREDAINYNAPLNANAYLGEVVLTNQLVMCGRSYSAIVYFHIDDEQANRTPQPEKEYEEDGYYGLNRDAYGSLDGDAD